MAREPELFTRLSPPPGGLERLRGRLGRRRRRRRAAAGLLVASVVVWLLVGPQATVEPTPSAPTAGPATAGPATDLLADVDHPALVGWGRRGAPATPTPTPSPDVVRLQVQPVGMRRSPEAFGGNEKGSVKLPL